MKEIQFFFIYFIPFAENNTPDPVNIHPSTVVTPTATAPVTISARLSQDHLTAIIASCTSLGFVLITVCSILLVALSIAAAMKTTRNRKREGRTVNVEENANTNACKLLGVGSKARVRIPPPLEIVEIFVEK